MYNAIVVVGQEGSLECDAVSRSIFVWLSFRREHVLDLPEDSDKEKEEHYSADDVKSQAVASSIDDGSGETLPSVGKSGRKIVKGD